VYFEAFIRISYKSKKTSVVFFWHKPFQFYEFTLKINMEMDKGHVFSHQNETSGSAFTYFTSRTSFVDSRTYFQSWMY